MTAPGNPPEFAKTDTLKANAVASKIRSKPAMRVIFENCGVFAFLKWQGYSGERGKVQC